MNNEDLVLKMILDESGFSAGMDKAVKQLGKFDGQVENTSQRGGRSLGGIWTSFVGNFLASGATKIISTGIGMITSSVDGAINRVDTLNNSNRVFENMGFNAKETASTMEALKQSINGLPTPLDGAIKGVQLLASSTNDLGKSEQIFSALNNGILGFGGNAEMVDNAIIQLSQSFSNGKVDAQTWNSMINSGLGPALNALAKQMGITTGAMKEGLSEGSISVEQFQDALIDLNKNGGGGLKSLEQIAKDSTAGIKTGIANMKTAVVRGVANIITSFDEGLKGAGFDSISVIIADMGSKFESGLNKMAQAIPPLMKDLKGLYDKIAPFAPLILTLVGVLGTFTAVLKVQQTIQSVSTAFKAWKATTEGVTIAQKILNATLLANPIALIVTAIITLTAGIVYLWKTNEDFRKAVIDIWEGIKKTIVSTADFIVEKWKLTQEWFSKMWTDMLTFVTPFVEGLKITFEPLITWFSGLWENIRSIGASMWELIKLSIMGPALLIIDLLTGDFTKFKSDFANIWKTLSDNVSNINKRMKDVVVGYYKALWGTAVNIFNSMKDDVIGFGNKLKDGFSKAISNMVDNVKGFISKTVRVFDQLSKIDLWEAGKAIMDSLVKGMKQEWKKGMEFVGGIGDWIRKNKGPIEYDRKLLVNNGMAIMDGLNKGIRSGFEFVKKTVRGAAGELNKEFNSNLDTPQFNVTGKASVVSKPNETVLTSDSLSNKTKQGDVFNINLQSLGELSEVQLMRMAEQLVKYIKDVKDREDAPKGGPVFGI